MTTTTTTTIKRYKNTKPVNSFTQTTTQLFWEPHYTIYSKLAQLTQERVELCRLSGSLTGWISGLSVSRVVRLRGRRRSRNQIRSQIWSRIWSERVGETSMRFCICSLRSHLTKRFDISPPLTVGDAQKV